MSSVLKALKKLENERNGNTPAPASAAEQRWASGGQVSFRQHPWLFLASGLAIGLLVAIALVWFGRREPLVTSAPVPVAISSATGQTPVPKITPMRVEPRIEPEVVREVQTAAPVAEPVPSSPAASTASAPAGRPSPATPAPSPAHIPATASAPAPEAAVKPVRVDRVEIPAPGQQWVAPSQLIVTEIFPPAAGERMAIVNGLPVMAGTMVDEAMVEEIHDDRIVVTIDGRRVAVPLAKGR